MKKKIKIVVFVFLAIVLYLGVITILPAQSTLTKPTDNDEEVIQLATSDDIEGWDINIDEVKQVEIHSGFVDVILTEEEKNRILHAFNAIQKEEIYWDQSLENAYEYGAIGIGITVVMKNDEKVTINPTQDFRIGYNGEIYATRYHLDIYDEVRQLQTKYNFQWTNNSFGQQMKDFESNLLFGLENDYVVNPDIRIIQATFANKALHCLTTLPFHGFKTFSDYLKAYGNELVINDTIEINGYIIKIIEIDNGEVTTITVSKKQ